MVWTFYYGLLSAFASMYNWILVLQGLEGMGIGQVPQAYVCNPWQRVHDALTT
jgi:hypothetical protein